ncbi:MAG: amidohydrolase family protein [Bryobacteraceae bacterium]
MPIATPWGNLEVSDAHIHFFSHRFFSLLAAQRGGLSASDLGPILGWEIPAAPPEELAARWVSELDRHGVKRAALIASLPGDEESVDAAVAAFPDRFYGYFMANPCAPDAAIRVEKMLSGGRMRGLCLFPAMHRYSIQSEQAATLLEFANRQPGTVVFVHCGALTVGVRKKLGLPSPFDMSFSNPIDLHTVALRFPQLRFVVPHFGAGYFRETLMLADLCQNVYLDTSSSNSWMRYQAAEIDLTQVFRRSLDVVGPQRLLFGTDSSFFSRGWQRSIFDAQVVALMEVGIGADDARLIFGRNLERLLLRR